LLLWWWWLLMLRRLISGLGLLQSGIRVEPDCADRRLSLFSTSLSCHHKKQEYLGWLQDEQNDRHSRIEKMQNKFIRNLVFFGCYFVYFSKFIQQKVEN
jgi:hypothetical protein